MPESDFAGSFVTSVTASDDDGNVPRSTIDGDTAMVAFAPPQARRHRR